MRKKMLGAVVAALVLALAVAGTASAFLRPSAAQSFAKRFARHYLSSFPGAERYTVRPCKARTSSGNRYVCRLFWAGTDPDTGTDYVCQGFITVTLRGSTVRAAVSGRSCAAS